MYAHLEIQGKHQKPPKQPKNTGKQPPKPGKKDPKNQPKGAENDKPQNDPNSYYATSPAGYSKTVQCVGSCKQPSGAQR